MGTMDRLGKAIATAFLCLHLIPAPAFAHSWQDAVEDMTPAEVEGIVAKLEATLETPPPDGWAPPEDTDGAFDLAIEFAVATDQIGKLDGTVERILMTYDALRFGVINGAGEIVADTDIEIWLDYIRPQDALAVAPFTDRLDTWRTDIEQASNEKVAE